MRYDSSINKVYRSQDEYIKDCYAGLPNEAMLIERYESLPEVKISYDSESDTLKHIKSVANYLMSAAIELLNRAKVHDNSKLDNVEKEGFDKYTPLLKGSTYGSEEYNSYLIGLRESLDNHYRQNTHHPEHYANGINGMNLFDLVEMFFDWKAAGERHANGDIYKSIEVNKVRFEMSEQVESIFINTAKHLNF
jgi:hypothetical protein